MAASSRYLQTGSIALVALIVVQVWLSNCALAYYLPQRPANSPEGNYMYNQMLANQASPQQMQAMLPHSMAHPIITATRDRISNNRRQDFDDDEDMDQNASSPYQNQPDDGQSNANNDGGYDDNEPDGAYQETPRDQESQSDLERFFDDHLGASDKDGMDKENLPTNWSPVVVKATGAINDLKDSQLALGSTNEEQLVPFVRSFTVRRPSELDNIIQQELYHAAPLVWRRQMADYQPGFMVLPDTAAIQNPQVPNPLSGVFPNLMAASKNEIELLNNRPASKFEKGSLMSAKTMELSVNSQEQSQSTNNVASRQKPPDHIVSNSSDIVMLKADDYDEPVYMTNLTDKPFRIAALGNFDPEEDFEHASRDIEIGGNDDVATATSRRSSARSRRKHDRRKESLKPKVDPFDELDNDPMTEDASEQDEVTFGQDDPYQTDLEAEMRDQAYDKIGRSSIEPRAGEGGDGHQSAVTGHNGGPKGAIEPVDDRPRRQQQQQDSITNDNDSDDIDTAADDAKTYTPAKPIRRPASGREYDSDDSEGSWVNDGVDDMEIPSQAHQNMILDKAAQNDLDQSAKTQQVKKEDHQGGENTTLNSEAPRTDDADNAPVIPNHVVDTGRPVADDNEGREDDN